MVPLAADHLGERSIMLVAMPEAALAEVSQMQGTVSKEALRSTIQLQTPGRLLQTCQPDGRTTHRSVMAAISM